MNAIKVIGLLILGSLILFGSIARISRPGTADNNEESLRVLPVNFEIKNDDGSRIQGEYKLPASGMLPDNPFYGLKLMRNWIWMHLSSGEVNKTKIMLLIADKNLSEAIGLLDKGNERKAWEATIEATKKLSETVDQLENVGAGEEQLEQLKFRLREAIMAYKEVVKRFEGSTEIDTMDQQGVINNLGSWSEKI